MARLRRNHQKSKSGSLTIRFIIFVFILLGFFWLMKENLGKITSLQIEESLKGENLDNGFFLPNSTGQLVHHANYSISYIEEHEQSEWVAYKLTRRNLKKPNVERSGRFNPDYDIKTRSAFHRDYTRSGFTRGHLAPAGDMAHNSEAMKESFLMSNISPQLRSFNNGIWKELEEQVRDWAFSAGEIYIVTGPILTDPELKRIGQNRVSVPNRFFKIILDLSSKNDKAIAFIIPNKMCIDPLKDYVVTIDNIEEITSIDFFPELLNDKEEEKLESEININNWKFSRKRHQLRIDKWNHQ